MIAISIVVPANSVAMACNSCIHAFPRDFVHLADDGLVVRLDELVPNLSGQLADRINVRPE